MKTIQKTILSAALGLCLLAFSDHTPTPCANAALAGRVTTLATNLNVRSQGNLSSPVIASLKKGSLVTLISQDGNYWYVEYADGKFGYCHSNYIAIESETTAVVATAWGNLNVRSGKGTSYSIIGSLKKGEEVVVLSESGGWSQILFDGVRTGYVSSSYLSKTSSEDTNAAVSLAVPNYKQTDSRWANVLIGSSNKTIGQIGCTTTGMAMLESFRTGTTIYPDAMSKKLSYSSSGDLYWPSSYTVSTNGTNLANTIYQTLKSGKPIMIGAKNIYGSQHWVIVTGFTGGDLSYRNFTINDPGSSSRKTLQDFFNLYPNFYKWVRY